jgi:hypothetical protein
MELKNYKFISSSHSRYQNNELVGTVDNCYRGVDIVEDTKDTSKYLVTIYILDDEKSRWGDNIQMATKQMKIINESDTKIDLKGFGYDNLGSSFADYGITLILNGNEIEKIILNMFDRNVEMHYYREKEINSVSQKANRISFTASLQGGGPGRASDITWQSWLDLENGTVEETSSNYILINKSGQKFEAKKGEFLAAQLYNNYLSHERTLFELSEGSNPTGGVFVIYRFKDTNRRNEFIIASPFGMAGGSSIAFKIL